MISRKIETPFFTIATLIGMEDTSLVYDDGESLWSVNSEGMIDLIESSVIENRV